MHASYPAQVIRALARPAVSMKAVGAAESHPTDATQNCRVRRRVVLKARHGVHSASVPHQGGELVACLRDCFKMNVPGQKSHQSAAHLSVIETFFFGHHCSAEHVQRGCFPEAYLM